ncbi:MAG: DUF892 family protein [Solirubrobacterales bacterium]|nr:DUF892 family protein [Solirubrobacterales bacterium]
MPEDATLTARDAKLIDWLDEAHAKEAQMQANLAAQVELVAKPAYQKRVRAHLGETEKHGRSVAARIGELGGTPGGSGTPAVVAAVGEAAGKAMAAVRSQIAARTPVVDPEETQLRVASEQLREEHDEIAIYTRIEALAEAVGDAETAKLARAILRDEERMAKYLTTELPKLVREVVRAEIPADQRPTPRRRRAGSASGSTGTASGSAGTRASGSSGTRASGSTRSRASGSTRTRSSGSTRSRASG